jgi:hypothetical protein
MTFPVQIGVIGWIIALVTLIIVLVLILRGQIPLMPIGIVLLLLALSRLL